MNESIYPIKLLPVTKNIIWGGTTLSEKYSIGEKGEKIAEAWLLCARCDGDNVISNGKYKGMLFSQYLKESKSGESFPLLIKLIDAKDKLSVQVHPDDEIAKKEGEPQGKTEMWYIVDASPDAKIVYGLQSKFNKDIFKAETENGTLETLLHYQPVKPGEIYYIPAGLVHAIGENILIAEIQQNSNTTYRIYDYNRRDKDGNLRQLHTEKAFSAIKDFSLEEIDALRGNIDENTVCDNEFFKVCIYDICGKASFCDVGEFLSIIAIQGNGNILYNGEKYPICAGDSYYLPKGISDFEIIGDSLKIITSFCN